MLVDKLVKVPYLRNLCKIRAFFKMIIICQKFLVKNSKRIKGQLISKCPFGVMKSPQKTNEFFSRISALASKKRPRKNKGIGGFCIDSLTLLLLI